MILAAVPEVADGGYWYLVNTVTDVADGGETPGGIPGDGWCAWYLNGIAAIRCPEPVAGIETITGSVSGALTGGKPFGRVRGR